MQSSNDKIEGGRQHLLAEADQGFSSPPSIIQEKRSHARNHSRHLRSAEQQGSLACHLRTGSDFLLPKLSHHTLQHTLQHTLGTEDFLSPSHRQRFLVTFAPKISCCDSPAPTYARHQSFLITFVQQQHAEENMHRAYVPGGFLLKLPMHGLDKHSVYTPTLQEILSSDLRAECMPQYRFCFLRRTSERSGRLNRSTTFEQKKILTLLQRSPSLPVQKAITAGLGSVGFKSIVLGGAITDASRTSGEGSIVGVLPAAHREIYSKW
jgi:hypothetical protein